MAYYRCTGNSGGSLKLRTVQGDICTFEPTISEPLVNVKCELTPSLDGYSAVNLTACGVNLWDEEWVKGVISSGIFNPNGDRVCSKNFIPVKPSTRLYIASNIAWVFFYSDANESSYISNAQAPITTPANCKYIKFYTTSGYGQTYNNDLFVSLEDTTYHPYTGNAYAIALGDTYYGGTLDVTTGVLTVTYGGVDLSTLNWTSSTYGYRTTELSDLVKLPATDNIQANIISENYNPVARNNIGSQGDNNIAISTSGNILVSSTNTPTGKLTYELATPIVIDLGSGTAVTARAGVNNVFADCGQTELKYLTLE